MYHLNVTRLNRESGRERRINKCAAEKKLLLSDKKSALSSKER
jgi:hypothetical protein